MKNYIYLFATLFVFVTGAAFTSHLTTGNVAWQVDPVHSTISFTVRHFFTPFQGAFNTFEGTVNYDPENPAGGSAEISIDVASIDSKNERRDAHLKNADFFDAENHPKITFKSTKFVAGEENQFTIVGNLTMHGTTKETEITGEFLGAMDHPRREGDMIGGMKGKMIINRNDFGVGSGNFAATTTIGDEVTIDIFLEMSGKKEG